MQGCLTLSSTSYDVEESRTVTECLFLIALRNKKYIRTLGNVKLDAACSF